MSSGSSLRSRFNTAFQGRTRTVLVVALIIWGLALFDLTLLPRNPNTFLPFLLPERLVGVVVQPDVTIVTSTPSTRPPGPWLITPVGKGVRVVGADLPDEHDPKRRRDRRFTAALKTTVPNLGGTTPFDVAAWDRHTPALFTISSTHRRHPRIDVYALSGKPRRLLSTTVPLPAQTMDRRDFAVERWSGPRPDLFVIERNAQRRKPKRTPSFQPWSVRIYSGESGFKRQIVHSQLRPKLSRRLSKYEWWVAVGSRHHKKPDIVLVTRERKTGSQRTEIHILSGKKLFHQFSVHAATALPQRIGPERQFVFQPDSEGGSVLMLKTERGQFALRAAPLP
ncbi:MAG TPA: hypothetical protein VH042_01195 [Solirubrobacterales bacterium]|nr:hypothetical protein [Solirubrobacterales bacterium]